MRQQTRRSDRKRLAPRLGLFFSFLRKLQNIAKRIMKKKATFSALLSSSRSPLSCALFLSPSPQATTPRSDRRRTPPFSRNADFSQAPLPGAGAGKERPLRPKRGGGSTSICSRGKNKSRLGLLNLSFLSEKKLSPLLVNRSAPPLARRTRAPALRPSLRRLPPLPRRRRCVFLCF